MLTRNDIANVMTLFVPNKRHYEDIVWDLHQFNRTFEVGQNRPLYLTLLQEETYEFMEEFVLHGATQNLLKETADVLYVLEGLLGMIEDEIIPDDLPKHDLRDTLECIEYDIFPVADTAFTYNQIYMAFRETHRSNMSKLDKNGFVLRREDGKVMKSDQFTKADMSNIYNQEQRLLRVKSEMGI